MSIRKELFDSFFLPEPFYGSWHSYPNEGDIISPQAFGRNTYQDKEVGVVIKAIHERCNGDSVAMFQELSIKGFDPGHPNRMLALRCIELAKEPWGAGFDEDGQLIQKCTIPRTVIGQWEVLYAMWHYEPDWYAKNEKVLIPIWPPLKGYLGTRGMLLIVKNLAEQRHLHTPVLIAHPEHIQRCFFIARKIFGKGQVATDHEMIRYDTRSFDQGSVQKWTQSEGAWLRYEMMARVHHLLHGWM